MYIKQEDLFDVENYFASLFKRQSLKRAKDSLLLILQSLKSHFSPENRTSYQNILFCVIGLIIFLSVVPQFRTHFVHRRITINIY